jgi:hypothetical protein
MSRNPLLQRDLLIRERVGAAIAAEAGCPVQFYALRETLRRCPSSQQLVDGDDDVVDDAGDGDDVVVYGVGDGVEVGRSDDVCDDNIDVDADDVVDDDDVDDAAEAAPLE